MTLRAVLVMLAAGCVTGPVEPLPPVVDAGCMEACSVQRELRCEGGEPTEDGEPCESVCDVSEDLVPGSYHTGCVSASRDCDEVERCFE